MSADSSSSYWSLFDKPHFWSHHIRILLYISDVHWASVWLWSKQSNWPVSVRRVLTFLACRTAPKKWIRTHSPPSKVPTTSLLTFDPPPLMPLVGRCSFLLISVIFADCFLCWSSWGSVRVGGVLCHSSSSLGDHCARETCKLQVVTVLGNWKGHPNEWLTLIRNIWELNIDEFRLPIKAFYILVCHMLIRSILRIQKECVKMLGRWEEIYNRIFLKNLHACDVQS